MSDAPNTIPEAVYVSGVRWTDPRPPAGPDEDRTPMTRTELAMLWDGLNTWLGSHPLPADFDERRSARLVRDAIDAELTERFGG